MEKAIGLRRGSWTYEEDKLLKACINKYGEGKWHLVPARAGLNRCRKSCRLRWLNYLKPNIKRGSFAEDEVDMILRLHKLLGNRWSLIAGRLPGRTANDVKNYWHTHLLKKVVPNSNKLEEKKEKVQPKETKITHHEIIKPRATTLSANSSWLKGRHDNFASDVGIRECATPLVASNEDVNVTRECDIETMLPKGGDGDWTAQPCSLPATWWENLWNMEDQLGNEKIGPNSNKLEEKKEKEQTKETKKAHHHEVIKPQPRTFSANSSWLKGKYNNVGVRECATPPLLVSNEDVNVPREFDMLPNSDGISDGDCTAQPCPLSATWWENFWSMEDQVGNEDSLLEFSKDFFSTEDPTCSDFYLDFNFCDVNSLLDL